MLMHCRAGWHPAVRNVWNPKRFLPQPRVEKKCVPIGAHKSLPATNGAGSGRTRHRRRCSMRDDYGKGRQAGLYH